MFRHAKRFAHGAATFLVLMGLAAGSASAAASDPDPTFGSGGKITRDVVPGLTPDGTNVSQTFLLSSGETVVAGDLHDKVFVARFTAAGALDPSFGGVREFDIDPDTFRPEEVRGLSVDSSGRVVIGGRTGNSGYVLRLTSSGALDTGFGNGGKLIFTDPGGLLVSDVETTDGDAVYVLTSGYPSRVRKYTSSGTLDSSFGVGGVATAANSMNDTKMALDLAGRVVVAGSDSGTNANYYVYRLQGPGDAFPGFYDTSFDSDGLAHITGFAGEFIDVEVTTSNRPMLLGDGQADGFELVMLNVSGAPDSGFNTTGRRIVNPLAGSTETPQDLAVDSGFAYVGGATQAFMSTYGFITSITSTGALDFSFSAGDATVEPSCSGPWQYCPIKSVSTRSTDLSFAANETAVPGANRMYVGSVDYSGNLRAVFDGDGRVSHQNQRPWDSHVADSFMNPDGSIITVGEYGEYGNYETYIHKQTASGAADIGFGSSGTLTRDLIPGADDNVSGVVATGDGAIYVVGTDQSGIPDRTYVAKFTSAGLETGGSFGMGGFTTVGIGAGDYYSGSIALDSAGRLLLAGTQINGAVRTGWVTRFSATTGASDTGYNSGLPINVDFTDDTNEGFWEVGELADGSVLATGAANGRLALLRTDSTGVGVAGFGSNGIVESTGLGTITAGSNTGFEVIGGSIHIGATVSDPAGESIRVARLASDGSIDASYGTAGLATIDTGPSSTDTLRDLATDGAGRLLVFGSHRISGLTDSLTARLSTGGAPDSTFGSNGIAVADNAGGSLYDNLVSGFVRNGKLVAVGNSLTSADENTLLTVQLGTNPVVPPPAVDRCTPAKRKLSALKRKLKSQKKALKKAKTRSRKASIKKKIRKTNKQIRSARRDVARLCI